MMISLVLKQVLEKHALFYANPNQLSAELMRFTDDAKDKKKIRHLCQSINKFSKAPSFSYKKNPITFIIFFDKLGIFTRFLPYMSLLKKYNSVLIKDYANSYNDPRIREILSYIFYDPDIQYSVFPPLFTLSNMYNKNAGYPEGGGYGLAKSMETTYIEQGGEIFYKKACKKKLL